MDVNSECRVERFMVIFLRLPSRRKPETSVPISESSEARQKFANAKAISSDMFFGRENNAEVPVYHC